MDGQILKGNSKVKICGDGYGLFPFLHVNMFVQKHHFFSYVKISTCTEFPGTCSTYTVNHPSIPEHVPSSPVATVSCASIPSEVVQGLGGNEIKRKLSGQCLSILSEPPLSLIIYSKTKGSSKLSRYKIERGSLFSSTSLPVEMM